MVDVFEIWSSLIANVRSYLRSKIIEVKSYFIRLFNILRIKIRDLERKIDNITGAVVSFVSKIRNDILRYISRVVENLTQFVTSRIQHITSMFTSAITKAVNMFSAKIAKVKSLLNAKIASINKLVESRFSSLSNKISTLAKKLTEQIKTKIASAISFMQQHLGKYTTNLQSISLWALDKSTSYTVTLIIRYYEYIYSRVSDIENTLKIRLNDMYSTAMENRKYWRR